MKKTLRELATTEISEFVHRGLSVFEPGDAASRVLGEIEETGRYEVAVSSGDRYGIITIRDLLDVDQPEQTKLGDYSDGIWEVLNPVSPDDLLMDVAHFLMEHNVQAVPVVEGSRVAGIISQVDISNALCAVPELSDIPAMELIKRPVITLDVGDRVAKARRLMLVEGLSHLPVTESGRLVGMVTAGDIVHAITVSASRTTHGGRGEENVTRFPGLVSGVMDVHPFTVGLDASALDVVWGLRDMKKIACIMVDEGGSILGIMTPREMISILLRLRMEEELPVYIVGLTDRDGFYERAVAEDKVRRVVERTMKFHPRITEVSVKIKRQQPEGTRVRYQVSARAFSAVEQFIVTAEGWGLLESFDKLCENLDKKLRRRKRQPERSPRRRRGRR
ncbi:MAG: CBS domain-containing protein [Candidatus Bathyarchaeia archaeon]